MNRPANLSACRLGKSNVGEADGAGATTRSRIWKDEAERRLFPPLDRALVTAIACETVAETEQPLSRQSVADLTRRVNETLERPMSRATVWRILDEDAIKPWQYEHWIFPRDPAFGEKAGPILDLYAGQWNGQPLGPKDFVLSGDEKTSIQARRPRHDELPPGRRRKRRVESEYKRKGALQYWRFGMSTAARSWAAARPIPGSSRLVGS
jgi:hypothetical protein